MSAPVQATRELATAAGVWAWPTDPHRYDTTEALSGPEQRALRALSRNPRDWQEREHWPALRRLVDPLCDARRSLHSTGQRGPTAADNAAAFILQSCLTEQRTYWGWDPAAWGRVCGRTPRAFYDNAPVWAHESGRHYVIALAYLLGEFVDPLPIEDFERVRLAKIVFGSTPIDAAIARVDSAAAALGYRASESSDACKLHTAVCEALLLARSPDLEALSGERLDRLRGVANPKPRKSGDIYRLHRALASVDIVAPSTWKLPRRWAAGEGVNPAWRDTVDRWYETSTLAPGSRRTVRSVLFQVGRWLADDHPQFQSPTDWNAQHCATFLARVDRWCVGDHTAQGASLVASRVGQPLRPRAKAHRIYAVRQFFRDCQEWEWIPRRFDPSRSLGTPRNLQALIGPDPRVIDDKVWAKLMWAGLNLNVDDFPRYGKSPCYPIEMLRALTLTWLFAGLRSDEIERLRVGCVRWQQDGLVGSTDGHVPEDAVCLLDVPTNKTGTAFTKPVDPLVGRAIAAWEAVRPVQPALLDRKVSTTVDMLYCYRGHTVHRSYINGTIIPSLCRKAGVPLADARGRLTSHRGRATIATQLYNAKDPMTLFELQAWLGHRSPQSTQHYARITPTTLTKAYRDAGYFARNVRAIEVLIDRDAIESGAAASGTPWRHVDLGHGYCTYTFFEQCPHRMACARCEYYVPKESSKANLIEAKGNLQRMLVEIPLTEHERAAVEDGGEAVDRLLERLAEVPAPGRAVPTAATPVPLTSDST
ncbi:MAG: tyrosine-type recombinase/integrase [Candidatus Dormibacteraeota bacterium]|nr:tyrosine-type recombinase/integrase [Candidatus Dormibacteraeota bacterium]